MSGTARADRGRAAPSGRAILLLPRIVVGATALGVAACGGGPTYQITPNEGTYLSIAVGRSVESLGVSCDSVFKAGDGRLYCMRRGVPSYTIATAEGKITGISPPPAPGEFPPQAQSASGTTTSGGGDTAGNSPTDNSPGRTGGIASGSSVTGTGSDDESSRLFSILRSVPTPNSNPFQRH